MGAGGFVEGRRGWARFEEGVDFAGADVGAELVVRGAVEIDALGGGEGVGVVADDDVRILVEPTLPDFRAPIALLVVKPVEAAGLADGGGVVGGEAR